MKVKLSIMNRLSLLGLLINEGDITTLKILRELREELSFTPEEHVAINFRPQPDGKLIWNDDADPNIEVEFTGIREIILEKVKTQLKEWEKAGTLKLDYLSLYEVLIEGQDEKEAELKLVNKEYEKQEEEEAIKEQIKEEEKEKEKKKEC